MSASDDARRLTARLLAEIGVEPGFLVIDRAAAIALVERALLHGGRIALAETKLFAEAHCRVCGCSQFNACRPESGGPCAWARVDLCTVCDAYPELAG